jgi:HEAT repeat protein
MAAGGRKNADAVLALALASGQTVDAAADRAGIGERTAYRRLTDPKFRVRVSELRAEMVERALGKLAEGMAEAVDTLRRLLGAERESVRLAAARAILEMGIKLQEATKLEELDARMHALETDGP